MLQKNKLLLLSTAVIATAAIAVPVAEASSYTVVKGDNLTKIANANKITVSQLKQWNNLKNDFLYVGQKLSVSAAKQATASNQAVNNKNQQTTQKASTPTTSKTPAGTNATASIYTVVKGDNLSKIAKAVNATVANIKKWNGLTSDAIFAGQQLKIGEGKIASTQPSTVNKEQQPANVLPDSSANLQTYQVMKGDSLSKIATKFSVTVADIKNWNQFNSDLIYIGQVIKVIGSALGEPVIQLDSKEEIKADQAIDAKLSKEMPIKNNVSANGQAIYSKAIELANAFTGTPYLFAGNSPAGFDCSGFVKYVYSIAGIEIARKSSNDYFMYDTTVVQNPQPGDLVFFKNTYIEGISHMGIYLGGDQFIHAGSSGVQVSKLSYDYWDSRFVAFKRFNLVK